MISVRIAKETVKRRAIIEKEKKEIIEREKEGVRGMVGKEGEGMRGEGGDRGEEDYGEEEGYEDEENSVDKPLRSGRIPTWLKIQDTIKKHGDDKENRNGGGEVRESVGSEQSEFPNVR